MGYKKPVTIIVCLVAVAATSAGSLWVYNKTANANNLTHSVAVANGSSKTSAKASGQVAAGFNKSQFSLTDPASLWVVVNKHRQLAPKDYVPAGLIVPTIAKRSNITTVEAQVRPETSAALKTMFDAATAAGLSLNLQSGYRSYNFQVSLYNGYVQSQGKAVADTQSARPGYSEHQTGLAADIGGSSKPACNVEACFATTPEGVWLAANAYKYGFIIRYPADKTAVTGYTYEPWHVRYIGTELASELHDDGTETLEEFFGLDAAPDYN